MSTRATPPASRGSAAEAETSLLISHVNLNISGALDAPDFIDHPTMDVKDLKKHAAAFHQQALLWTSIITELNAKIFKNFNIIYNPTGGRNTDRAEFLRGEKLQTYTIAASTAFFNMASCGLLLSSSLHAQLAPLMLYLQESFTAKHLKHPLMSDVRRMGCIPPCFKTVPQDAADSLDPSVMDLDDQPATLLPSMTRPDDPSAMDLDDRLVTPPVRTCADDWSDHITKTLREHIGIDLTPKIVADAAANLNMYVQLLKDFSRGSNTIVERFMNIRHSIS
ncbi:hypothetical protein HDU90_003011 [Geranomyces variabilis]|nr:hypothetical protein HDU90_003011 [Geranomyces variabilis]